jgi:DNA-binding MarR family transcriptional regulator
VLRILRGAGEPLPTMEIGERLVQPTPGITRLIARLERDGFVERQPNPADARSVLVALTPSGRARLTKADPIVASVDDELGQGLSDKELSTLVKLLNKLRSRFG